MTAPRRPPGRYDEPRALPSRPVLLGLGGTAGLLALLAAYALFSRTASEPIGALLGYQIVSDRAVDVRFEVSRKPGSKAVCLIRARDAGGAEVGRAEVPVNPAGGRQVRLTYRLATTARANTGEVADCLARP